MGKPILPETIREDIKDLFRKGYTRDSVFQFERDEVLKGSSLPLTVGHI